ncbi:Nitrite-sensitive transcriptional repressor NsrR [Marinobacterium lacunae]|uniref:Nitrite-sensitive transcriptional repressor NsrR n=1 Tax=Marinobacterium lacunae TaxID=1232683 RepID=A0A081FT64_9GAMM|nr:Rrf2 family transcriptional regulator [Marinobacterium lacunae]KEA61719.1 Nitrite-sensitive transcriptional repressor NsrR [Marinobacterium lacunae]MBR9884408.1 Rrf2 family transcriptional regulator [Oceanospirillales bacterium]
MQLTKYTDFSLRTLIFLGVQDPESRVTISQVSEHFQIPRNHLIKIVHHLGKEGFIDTVRGKGGGIRLGMPADQINLRTLVESTEETLKPVNCELPHCPIVGNCRLQGILFQAQEAFMRELSNYTLADICSAPEQIAQLLKWTTGQSASALN